MAVSLKQAVLRETAIGTVINMVLVTLITWLSLPDVEQMPLLGGPESAGFGLFPASTLFPFFATLLISALIRKQVRSGKISGDSICADTLTQKLPASDIARGLLFALFFGALIAPLTLAAIYVTGAAQWTYASAFILNVLYILCVTLALVPTIVRSAAWRAAR